MPSEETYFQKGRAKTGGKPKGYKSIRSVLKELVDGKITVDDPIAQKKRKITAHEAICLKMVVDALKGDFRARMEYFNRMEGRAQEFVDVTHGGSLNIQNHYTNEQIKDLLKDMGK